MCWTSSAFQRFVTKETFFFFLNYIGNNTVLQLTWNKWVQSVEAEQMFGDDFPHSYTHNQASGRHWPSMNWRPASVRVGTHSKRKKNKLLSDAWSKRPSSCSEHSASCSGTGGGVGRREVRWYKRWTQCLWRPEALEFVVPSQSFAEVGHLAADKQVLLVQNFFLGQAAVLAGDRTDIVNRVRFGATWSGVCCENKQSKSQSHSENHIKEQRRIKWLRMQHSSWLHSCEYRRRATPASDQRVNSTSNN